MDERPITFIVRLWSRPDEFRVEVKLLQGGETLYFKSASELVAFFELSPPAAQEGLDA